ncbi:MAG: OmpW family protein [Beijerinckiaceae bacterium]
MKRILMSAAAACAMMFAAGSAQAADIPDRVEAVAPAPVETFNPWMIRVRAIGVLPQSSATVSAFGAPIAGAGLKVSNSIVPEVDISYFFTPNWAVEAICCLTPHRIKATGTIAGLGRVGSTLVFPPTVMFQYHFTGLGALKPYIGLGVNYTHYFRNSAGPAFANLRIRDSFGVAAQIGFDYMIDRHWGINVDVKRIMMQPNASVTLLPAVPVTAKVKIDPWIVGAGVTYRF